MHIYIYICMHTDSDLSTTEDLSKDVGFLYWFFFSAIFSHEFLFSYRLVDHALAFFFFSWELGPFIRTVHCPSQFLTCQWEWSTPKFVTLFTFFFLFFPLQKSHNATY